MIRAAIRCLAPIALAFVASMPASAADFYAGKQVTVLVNLAAGGPTDIEARLYARHLAKHIPGKPSIIVKNMTGAGGVVGTNYLGKAAANDGLTVGYYADIMTALLLEVPGLEVDLRKFDFVATARGVPVSFVRTDIAPGVKIPEDLLKAQEFKVGGLSLSSSKDVRIRMTLDLLGIKYKYVTGYKGTADVRRAFQQGEIGFSNESMPAYRAVIEPTLVKSGEAIPVWHYPLDDGDTLVAADESKGIPALPFHEFYRKVKGQPPSGEMWDAFRALNLLGMGLLRTIVMPPNSPPEALAAMRKATMALLKDQEYIDETVKTVKFVPDYLPGDTVQQQLGKLLKNPEKIRAYLKTYIAEGSTR